MANAYYAGSVGSFADLKTALETALVAEGWTLSSGILSKGAGFFRLESATAYLRLSAGAGQSGTSLTDATPSQVQIGSLTVADPIAWPIGYEIHINENPDEIYCVINHGVDRFQNLSFGVSPAPGNSSGIWINGTGGPSSSFTVAASGFFFSSATGGAAGNFAPLPSSGNQAHALAAGVLASMSTAFAGRHSWYLRSGSVWLPSATGNFPITVGALGGGAYAHRLMQMLPSAFNQALVLVPIYAVTPVSDNGTVIAGQLHHARHCRIDNYEPGAVVEYGPDKWKVYPQYRKNVALRSPGEGGATTGLLHTGTYGYAVRYHGT